MSPSALFWNMKLALNSDVFNTVLVVENTSPTSPFVSLASMT